MKTTTTIITATILILALTGFACGISIGAGPSTIQFSDVIKGGYAEDYFNVATSGGENLTCTAKVSGPIKDWIALDSGDGFILVPDTIKRVKVILQPPADIANGEYYGKINVVAAPTSQVGSGAGMAVGAGVEINVRVMVTGEQKISFPTEGVAVSDTELSYPIKFNVVITNTGNVKVSPPIEIEISDKITGVTKKTFTYTQTEVFPTKRQEIIFTVPSTGLDVGQYNAKVKVNTDEQTVSFNIMPKGTLALSGRLLQVYLNKIWVETGETVKITGAFKNEGDLQIEKAKLVVEAYLIDEKYQTEKLVKTVESEPLDVAVGESIDLSTYFTPEKDGRYRIRGVIMYSGKQTSAKESVLNVNPRPANYTPYYITIGVLVILIVYYLTRKGEDGRTRRFKKIWGDYLKIQ